MKALGTTCRLFTEEQQVDCEPPVLGMESEATALCGLHWIQLAQKPRGFFHVLKAQNEFLWQSTLGVLTQL